MMLFALALTVIAALVFYLTCAQQIWLRTTWPRVWRWAALTTAVAAVAVWCEVAGAAAGITAALTCAMLTWTLAPYLGWWWQARRGESP